LPRGSADRPTTPRRPRHPTSAAPVSSR
jgi:hypothetical protein